MKRLLRSLRTELRYETWSQMLLWPLVVALLSLVLSFAGTVSYAIDALSRLDATRHQASAHGISLAEAMSRPLNVSSHGGQQILDNPLRFDYEQAFNAHRALDGLTSVGTGLEMITFIVFPTLFFSYGCSVGVAEIRHRILKQRIATEGSIPFMLAKVVVVAFAALSCVLLFAAASAAVSPALKALFLSDSEISLPFALPDTGAGSVPVQIAFSAGTAIFFGQLGLFIGLASRAMVVPCLVAATLLLAAPFAGPLDPRNVLSTAAQDVFNFWGGFTPRALFQVPAVTGLLLMVMGLCLAALVCSLVWSHRSKFV